MKILFAPLPAHGHINPMLPLTEELVARGDDVLFLVPEDLAAGARAAGASILPIDDAFAVDVTALPRGLTATREKSPAPADKTAERLARMHEAGPLLQQDILAAAPDGVVLDPYRFWGPLIIRPLHIPIVPFFPTYAILDGTSMQDLMRILSGGRGSSPGGSSPRDDSRALAMLGDTFVAGDLNIVPIPRSFQPHAETFDDRYLFVGPTMRTHESTAAGFPLEQLTGRPVVYISLGTVASNNPEFYRTCFDAFADSDWLVVAATGMSDEVDLGPLPSNVLARPSVPQLAVLARSTVFVTHGGMNSTMEGLWQRMPLVVVPQFADQFLNATRVTDLGLGVALSPETVTGEAVRTAVESVADDPAMRERLSVFQAEMREGGGAPRAAAAIRRYLSGGSVADVSLTSFAHL